MKVVCAFLKYDYGIEKRGISLEREAFFPAIGKVVDEAIPFWLEDHGFPNDLDALQKALLGFLYEQHPDVVFFILMRDEITADTIEKISKDYFTINWFCDDQWRFEKFSRFIAPKLSLSITTDKYSVPKYEKCGCSNVMHSQWAVFEYVKDIDFESTVYEHDISFIGGFSPNRAWIVEKLQKAGLPVDCFGSGWEGGRLDYEEMKDVICKSKINLNLSNSISFDYRFLRQIAETKFRLHSFSKRERLLKFLSPEIIKAWTLDEMETRASNAEKNVEQLKARNFEIPGCGGFQLSQYCLEIEDYFEIGKEVAVFTNINDLLRQAEYYLSQGGQRERIKKAGYERAHEYTYELRMRAIFGHVQRTH